MTEANIEKVSQWQAAMKDPFREKLLPVGKDFPEKVKSCAEPIRDEPVFDPDMISKMAEKIVLPANIVFPHPMLERVVRVGLAHIDATFKGNHPKYGAGIYSHDCHDGFPPVIVSTIDALTLWGLIPRAEELFEYWFNTFVRPDGTISYRGTSLSEVGMLLTSVCRLLVRGANAEWLKKNFDKINLLVKFLRDLISATGPNRLLFGVPEDDERGNPATYFHNNAWVVRGLKDWSFVIGKYLNQKQIASVIQQEATQLQKLLIEVITEVWPKDASDWWLRATIEKVDGEPAERPAQITATRFSSYVNYRYWPELMSSGVLPKELMERIVKARLNCGGQFCGTTRFEDHLDDWPLAEWLEGLWNLGLYDDFKLCLWGHIYYHQAEGHLTAYEQVVFPPGKQYKFAAYCLPCQLVAVRAARNIVNV
ncbi:MAG: hypothetical protein ABFD79_16385 [Phycisphaerales bacterium]